MYKLQYNIFFSSIIIIFTWWYLDYGCYYDNRRCCCCFFSHLDFLLYILIPPRTTCGWINYHLRQQLRNRNANHRVDQNVLSFMRRLNAGLLRGGYNQATRLPACQNRPDDSIGWLQRQSEQIKTSIWRKKRKLFQDLVLQALQILGI